MGFEARAVTAEVLASSLEPSPAYPSGDDPLALPQGRRLVVAELRLELLVSPKGRGMPVSEPRVDQVRPGAGKLARGGAALILIGAIAVGLGAAIHSREADTKRVCEETKAMSVAMRLPHVQDCSTSVAPTIVMVGGGALAAAGMVLVILASTRPRRKVCPSCAQLSPTEARVCGSCGTSLGDV
jgi:hypothetical protein